MQPKSYPPDTTRISDETIAKPLRPLAPRKLARLFVDAERPFYILDGKDRLRFVNQALLHELAVDEATLIGLDCSPTSTTNTGRAAEIAAKLVIPTASRRVGLDIAPMGTSDESNPQPPTWSARLVVSLDSSFGNGSVGCWWLRPHDKTVQEFAKRRDWSHDKAIQSAVLASKKPFAKIDGLFCLIGSHPATVLARRQTKAASESSLSVLICGQAGSGKSTLAQSILAARQKKESRQPLGQTLPVECRLMDRRLMSEMIELVQERSSPGGVSESPSLLLKNIDQLPDEAHSVLASYLQKTPGCHVIATAGLDDLDALHDQSSDWKTLLAYVATIRIELLPLHQRPEDIAPTVTAVLEELQANKSPRERKHLSTAALRNLEGYAWPGEMREVVHSLQVSLDKTVDAIEPEHFPLAIRTFPSHLLKPEPLREIQLEQVLEDYERAIISQAIEHFPRNRAAAARHLGISRTKLLRRIVDLGIDSESETATKAAAGKDIDSTESAVAQKTSAKTSPGQATKATTEAAVSKDSETDAPIFIELAGDELRSDEDRND